MTISELKKEEEIIKSKILEMGKKINLTEKELIVDGIVSEEEYLDINNKYKIMWILKEGYNDNLGFKLGTDLLKPEERTKKASGKIIPTLRGMIYVTYGLLNDKSSEEMDLHKINSEMVKVLTRIAWVNISKACGKSNSPNEHIAKEYNYWKEILFKQIKTYGPDIIICGNTLPYLSMDNFFEKMRRKTFGPNPKNRYCYYPLKDRLYINTYHPAAYKHKKNFWVDYVVNAASEWEMNYKGKEISG
jgi:hypothetical protein